MALSRVPDYSTGFRYVIKTSLFCLSVTLLVVKVTQSYRHLDDQEIGTEVRLVNNLEVDLPAITVCKPEHEAYSPEVMESYGLHNGMEKTLQGFAHVDGLNVSMRHILESALWSHEDLLWREVSAYDVVAYVNFGYQGDNEVVFEHHMNSSNSAYAHWHPVFNPMYGRCQSLVVRREALAQLRDSLALIRMVFFDDHYEFNIPGWLVFLHTPFSFGSGEEVIPLTKGLLFEYQINPVSVSRMPTEKAHCVHDAQTNPGVDHVYNDREACLLDCLQKNYAKNNGCIHPKIHRTDASDGVPDCDYDYYNKKYAGLDENVAMENLGTIANALISEEHHGGCECDRPCAQKSVSASLNLREQYGQKGSANSVLVLKFPRSVQYFREYLVYQNIDFIADCGGFMGLFLGASIFSLHEVISGFVEWVAGKANGRKDRSRMSASAAATAGGYKASAGARRVSTRSISLRPGAAANLLDGGLGGAGSRAGSPKF